LHVRLIALDASAQEIADQTDDEVCKNSMNDAVAAVNEQYARVQELYNQILSNQKQVIYLFNRFFRMISNNTALSCRF